MLKKGSKVNSILTGTCPRCQNESMYVEKNPYNLATVIKMNENCGHCGLKYQLEPSFFYGAMYVSYGVNVAIGIAAFIIAYVFPALEFESFFYCYCIFTYRFVSFGFKNIQKHIHQYVCFLRPEF